MKKLLWVLLFCMVIDVQARIGWTKEQCDSKYGVGEVSKDGMFTVVQYEHSGAKIMCMFLKGKVHVIRYEFTSNNSKVPMKRLMDLNFPKKEWRTLDNLTFLSMDGKSVATCADDMEIACMTKEGLDCLEKIIEHEEKKKASNF